MDLIQFRKWMQNTFHCGPEILPVVNRVFHVSSRVSNVVELSVSLNTTVLCVRYQAIDSTGGGV